VAEGNRLWVNTNGYFIDTVTPKGPGASSLPFTGFGVGFADFDNDGNLDLYVANGKVKLGQQEYDLRDPYAEPNQLLRGLGGGAFEPVLPQGGTAQPLVATSRGLALGDLDNDGAIDLVVINHDGPAHVLRNLIGRRGHWIMVTVLNRNGALAFNAVLRIEAAGTTRWRQVIPNQSYCSSHDPRVHCGLGSAQQVDNVTVRWPGGRQETFGPFDTGQLYELREGQGRIAVADAGSRR